MCPDVQLRILLNFITHFQIQTSQYFDPDLGNKVMRNITIF